MPDSASVLLRNARIATAGQASDPHSITVRSGHIVDLRPAGEADPASGLGETAQALDLDGRWVVPGLWDHHVHFSQWSIMRDRLDLSGARSAAQAARAVSAARAERASDLLVGVGFRDALWPEPPSAQLLDEHSGERPVVLISGDLHAVWLNSAALRRFAPGRDQSGVLREQDAFDVQLAVADLPDDRVDALAAAAGAAAAARGVVGVVDFEMPDIGATWLRRISAGNKALRVVCSVWPSRLDEAVRRDIGTGASLPGAGGLATMGPLKVIIDGSLNTRTAYCFDAYPGPAGAGGHGLLTITGADLAALLETAGDARIEAAVHAIGDHANSVALDAFEQTGAHGSIEHAQLMAAGDVARLARLGLTASVQPEHAIDDRDVADRYWTGRTARAYAYRTLLDAGVPLALGSDAPVAPLDPWIAIAAAVQRTRTDRAPWHPEQRISRVEALGASVHNAIAAGEIADLAVVDRDPFSCGAGELRAMPVAATMLGGRWTFNTLA
jgi:hypothetical protein